ncbi:hypothetical protein [uncultured Prevotella sp.]|uniref:hypothetical protein n=1 Tax=uncultured Prevotella sp. TaxID=159272 RepID=UPI00266C2D3A|nr:hypothetical protein [uncultured Prevotella sp.]
MTHSIVVETANVDLTIKVFYEQQTWNFSRIPVYDKSKEYIIGYVLKDMVLKGGGRKISSRQDSPTSCDRFFLLPIWGQNWAELLSDVCPISITTCWRN